MGKVEKTQFGSFLKIMTYESDVFTKLNQPNPCYGDKRVDVISITPVGADKCGYPIFCYELMFREKNN